MSSCRFVKIDSCSSSSSNCNLCNCNVHERFVFIRVVLSIPMFIGALYIIILRSSQLFGSALQLCYVPCSA